MSLIRTQNTKSKKTKRESEREIERTTLLYCSKGRHGIENENQRTLKKMGEKMEKHIIRNNKSVQRMCRPEEEYGQVLDRKGPYLTSGQLERRSLSQPRKQESARQRQRQRILAIKKVKKKLELKLKKIRSEQRNSSARTKKRRRGHRTDMARV